MPMYEYRCDSCGNVFELIQKFSDEPLKSHPECGGTVARLISAPALQFKGTGWYITDYAKSNGKDTGSSEKADKKAEKAEKTEKKDASGDSKPSSDSSSKPASSPSSPVSSTASDKK